MVQVAIDTPRDILSRSGSRPQQQSQPALLPDKKGRQRIRTHRADVHAFHFSKENGGLKFTISKPPSSHCVLFRRIFSQPPKQRFLYPVGQFMFIPSFYSISVTTYFEIEHFPHCC